MHRSQPFVSHPGDVGDQVWGQAVEALVVVPACDEKPDHDCRHDLETEHDQAWVRPGVTPCPEVKDGTSGREDLAERLDVPDEVVETREGLGRNRATR